MILFDLATLTTLTLPSQGPRPHDGGRGPRRGPLVCSKFARRTKNAAAEPWGPAARCRCLLDGETRTL